MTSRLVFVVLLGVSVIGTYGAAVYFSGNEPVLVCFSAMHSCQRYDKKELVSDDGGDTCFHGPDFPTLCRPELHIFQLEALKAKTRASCTDMGGVLTSWGICTANSKMYRFDPFVFKWNLDGAASVPATTSSPIVKPKAKPVATPTQPEMTPAEFQAMYQTINYTAPAVSQYDPVQQQAQEQQQLQDWVAQTRAPFDAYEAQRVQIDALKEQIRQEVAAAGGTVDESQLEVMAQARLKN